MLKYTDPELQKAASLTINDSIRLIEIYRFDNKQIQKQTPWIDSDCVCGVLKLSCNGYHGWAEYLLHGVHKEFDLIRWANVFIQLKGISISEAVVRVKGMEEEWGAERQALIETAVLDLEWNIQHPFAVKRQNREDAQRERAQLIEQSQSYFSF
ncbi:hypothetical protein [Paenibacillus glycanilyticus]|uniref:Uncharacterized protein n=1 Tax=Paenibacillus glycanilyticus TaxID=126569 RepID=A0ABQ6G7D5_9BACL|nr:hypothetical protein [Paenibacillus glycanilyticus]GLX66360.1 hypothetical protein MU1_07040 [Paenibacillus glycanilyticus]